MSAVTGDPKNRRPAEIQSALCSKKNYPEFSKVRDVNKPFGRLRLSRGRDGETSALSEQMSEPEGRRGGQTADQQSLPGRHKSVEAGKASFHGSEIQKCNSRRKH
jgi:hypothetical protein